MNSRLFLRLTTTALFATFLASCATLKGIVDVKKPTAEVAGVSLGSLSLEQATLLVDVAVSNPNGFALDAAGFDLDLVLERVRTMVNEQSCAFQPDMEVLRIIERTLKAGPAPKKEIR